MKQENAVKNSRELYVKQIKSMIVYSMIACLTASALVAAVAIVANSFNDTTAKLLYTFGLIALHSIFAVILIPNSERSNKYDLTLNTTYGLVVASLLASVTGIWGLLIPESVGKLYAILGIVFFVMAHIDVFRKLQLAGKTMARLSAASMFFTAITGVIATIKIISYTDNEYTGRLLAAFAVLAGTPSVTTIIVGLLNHRAQLPKLLNAYETPKKHSSLFWVLVCLGALFVLPQLIGIIVAIAMSLSNHAAYMN